MTFVANVAGDLLRLDPEEDLVERDPGVADEDVEPPARLVHLGDRAIDRVRVGDVELADLAGASLFADARERLARRRLVAR